MIDVHHLGHDVSANFDPASGQWYIYDMSLDRESTDLYPTWEEARAAYVAGSVNWA